MPNSMPNAVQAVPPDLPDILRHERLRRRGIRGATANLLAALIYGDAADRWRFTSPEITVRGVQNV